MKKLYVGNLAPSTGDEQLQQHFEEYGPVRSCSVIRDRETNQSRCFGFVEIEDDERALDAISELDGSMLDGSQIKVNEARPKREFGDSRPSSGGRGGFRSSGGYGGGSRSEGGPRRSSGGYGGGRRY